MKHLQPKTDKGPSERFTGKVELTMIFVGEEPSRARMASVSFEAGAHTAWHKHVLGQYIHVIEGTAYVQERGGEVQVLKPGETIYTKPGVEHWHGATPSSPMVHLVVWEAAAPASNDPDVTWLEHVTDADYALGE